MQHGQSTIQAVHETANALCTSQRKAWNGTSPDVRHTWCDRSDSRRALNRGTVSVHRVDSAACSAIVTRSIECMNGSVSCTCQFVEIYLLAARGELCRWLASGQKQLCKRPCPQPLGWVSEDSHACKFFFIGLFFEVPPILHLEYCEQGPWAEIVVLHWSMPGLL